MRTVAKSSTRGVPREKGHGEDRDEENGKKEEEKENEEMEREEGGGAGQPRGLPAACAAACRSVAVAHCAEEAGLGDGADQPPTSRVWLRGVRSPNCQAAAAAAWYNHKLG